MSNKKIDVKGTAVTIITSQDEDYISLTDIAKHKTDDSSAAIGNWMRNRNTIEFLGIWEALYNPDFKPLEFDGIRQAIFEDQELDAEATVNRQLTVQTEGEREVSRSIALYNLDVILAVFPSFGGMPVRAGWCFPRPPRQASPATPPKEGNLAGTLNAISTLEKQAKRES